MIFPKFWLKMLEIIRLRHYNSAAVKALPPGPKIIDDQNGANDALRRDPLQKPVSLERGLGPAITLLHVLAYHLMNLARPEERLHEAFWV